MKIRANEPGETILVPKWGFVTARCGECPKWNWGQWPLRRQ